MIKPSFWKSRILTFGRQKKFFRKRPYLRNRWADIASRPLKSKLLAWATWKARQVVSNLPWEHRRARGAQKRGQKMTFLVFFAPKMVQNSDFTIAWSHPDLDGQFAAFGKSIARSLLKQETYGGTKNALSVPAEIPHKAISSKCDFKIEVWSKQQGRHQRPPISSCFIWFEPPWPAPLPQNDEIIIFEKSNSDLWPTKKVLTKTAISPEPLGRHRFKTPQIEALGLGNLKTTSGGL